MSAPPIHARTDGGSCFSGILHLRTSQFATVPTSDRFLMPFPFKQFFAALHLTVVTILDLEPRRSLRRVPASLCLATIPQGPSRTHV